jgi:hypothetical protein
MKHILRYNKLIDHYKNNPPDNCFIEKHHIVPLCMGGADEISNIIVLPARAHFIAHYLLHKAHPDNRKLAHAFAMMIVNNPYQKRNSKLYEQAKMARSSALKGLPRPEWVKEKLRKPKKNKENYCKPKSEEHKRNISNSLRGKKRSIEQIKRSVDAKKEYFVKLSEKTEIKRKHYRNLFIESNLSRKEFYDLYPELSKSTLKGYLSGL